MRFDFITRHKDHIRLHPSRTVIHNPEPAIRESLHLREAAFTMKFAQTFAFLQAAAVQAHCRSTPLTISIPQQRKGVPCTDHVTRYLPQVRPQRRHIR
jgi:hypothetical protein